MPADVMVSALETLGGAAAAAARLPDAVGAALLTSAQEAFTSGLRMTAALSAIVAVVVAIPAIGALRDVPPRDR